MLINKDTKIYGSFSDNPGNNGCTFFNSAFEKNGINAIYKSFYSTDIEKTIMSVKHLNFSGFALSMPLKRDVCKFLNFKDESVEIIGASNTVLIKEGLLHGYNTDWKGVYDFFSTRFYTKVNIIGNGGFASAIKYAFDKLGISYQIYKRDDIKDIDNVGGEYFINATPADIHSTNNTIIDARPFTEEGKEIFYLQAIEQFKIYTGVDYKI